MSWKWPRCEVENDSSCPRASRSNSGQHRGAVDQDVQWVARIKPALSEGIDGARVGEGTADLASEPAMTAGDDPLLPGQVQAVEDVGAGG